VLRLRGGWGLPIKTEEGKIVYIEASQSDLVSTLKARIFNATGTPEKQQNLLYRGQEIHDSKLESANYIACMLLTQPDMRFGDIGFDMSVSRPSLMPLISFSCC